MKNLLLTYTLFSFCLNLTAQEILNGNLNSNCTGNGFTAPSCVHNWFASHGTPLVQGNINKNTWASLTVNEENLEGIFTNYEFHSGKNYQISFKVKITTTINGIDKIISGANVRATNNLTSNFNTENPVLPNDSELIWSKNITKNTPDWETISISFTPKKNYNQLWFYINANATQRVSQEKYSQFEIDDIKITTSGQKKTNITEKTEHNVTAMSNSHRSSDYIFPETVQKNDFINVRISSGEISEIWVTDLAGNVFKTEFRVLSKNYINFQLRKDLYEGNYIVKAIKKDGTIISKNITIK
ncbi:conserved exported hypothetical protein [Flavobacterium sp. 9AF]|uniref:hypothetical protein n=1 Tax=Flavobacterium sp. 9AF TaxID=2653142 RepID=UPI0012F01AAD|nr:hypothetical protein [Flavobacterium sp. 9AF]VXC03004.1 conserved exported hypothetical protein [Flavobacterium sp. 9AF]